MDKNLTLTVDADVLKRARKYALDHDTSVNKLVRDYLSQLVRQGDELDAARKSLGEYFRTSRYKLGRRTWTRDELHERR